MGYLLALNLVKKSHIKQMGGVHIKKPKIVICTIADKLRGYGHFSRCNSLARELRKRGFEIIFITNQNEYLSKQLRIQKFFHRKFSLHNTPIKTSYRIKKIIESIKCKNIIIDMREFGEQVSRQLSLPNFRVILIDDAWTKKAYADIIFNGTIVRKYQRYTKTDRDTKFYLGSKYFIMNKEFSRYKKNSSEFRKKDRYSVVISMGGADVHLLTLFVLRSLKSVRNINIKVIVGPLFSTLEELNKLTSKMKNVTLVFSPKYVWKEFEDADVAICTAGSTLFELAVQRIPTICIIDDKHQIPYAKIFASKRFAVNLGRRENLNPDTISGTLTSVLMSQSKLKKMSRSAEKIIDGNGLFRVCNVIEKYVKIGKID